MRLSGDYQMSEDGTICVFAVFTFVCVESDVNKGSIEAKHSNFHESSGSL